MDNKENLENKTERLSNSEKRAKIAMYSKGVSASDEDAHLSIEPHEMTERPMGAPLKKQFRLEMSKLQKMTFKKKAEYIWEYYRFHLMGIVGALILVVSITIGILTPSPDTVLFVAWTGFTTETQRENLVYELSAAVVDESEHEQVDVVLFLSGGDDPMITMANMQRLVAMVASGQIDVFILDSETLKNYSVTGFVQPLESILTEVARANPSVYRIIEEYAFITDFEVDTGVYSEQIMGISLTYAPLIEEINFFYPYDLFFAVSSTSQQVENATKALIAFFDPPY